MTEGASKEEHHRVNPLDRLKSVLMEKTHPYGLLLMSAPFISAAAGTRIDASALTVSSGSSLSLESSGVPSDPGAHLLRDISIAGSLGLSSSGNTPQTSLSSAGLTMSSLADRGDDMNYVAGAMLSVLGASAGSDPTLATTLRNSFQFNAIQTEAIVAPLLASAKNKEFISTTDETVEIKNDTLRVGSMVANVFVYRGREPYRITGSTLDEPYVVNPGDKFLALHVNQGGAKYSKMEPLARVKAIRHDFQQLCQLLEKPEQFGLTDEQNQQVNNLREAPMIGVSHLVRLIAVRGLPTWNIDILPKAVQVFHTLDSQIVSRLFGGGRKVSIGDIRVMFLPASMRSRVF